MWVDILVLWWLGYDLNILLDIICLYVEYLRNVCKCRWMDGIKNVSCWMFEFDNVIDILIFR